MHALPINTRLQDGKLAVSKPLGQGGFGITYYGGDVQLRRYVAIKEFFPQGCTRQANLVQANGVLSENDFSLAKRKFLEEARVLAQFRHQGIVQVYGFFEENNTAYIVMEYLKGKTLAQLVEERGALPEKEAVGYIEKAAGALEEVHRTNHLHRDIKPENIMVCEDGRVVLIDFGLTKKVEESVGLGTRQFTNTTRFGSDGYAPPEQYSSSGILGNHTDIYALGATLYFLLTGKAPLSAMERGMMGQVLSPPKNLLPQISQDINDAVLRMMEMNADLRLQTTQDFASALTRSSKTPPSAIVSPSSAGQQSPAASASQTPPVLGKCSDCGKVNPRSFNQCVCGAWLPWSNPQHRPQIKSSVEVGAPKQTVSLEQFAQCVHCQRRNYIGIPASPLHRAKCYSCSREFALSVTAKPSAAVIQIAPVLPSTVPRTCDMGRVRFHGRNFTSNSSGPHDQYDIGMCIKIDDEGTARVIVSTYPKGQEGESAMATQANLDEWKALIKETERTLAEMKRDGKIKKIIL